MQYERRVPAKQQTKNFLTRNKNSVHVRSKQEAAKRLEKKEEEKDKKKMRAGMRPSQTNKSKSLDKENEEIVTISKNYLEKLLQNSLLRECTHDLPIPNVSPNQPMDSHPSNHIVTDHSHIPGLEGHRPNHSEIHSDNPNKDFYSAIPPLQMSPPFQHTQVQTEFSPRNIENYHRGTTNRPIHPAMRSQIVFGGDEGWEDEKREREEARIRWRNELSKQVEEKNSTFPSTNKQAQTQGGSGGVSIMKQSPREWIPHVVDHTKIREMNEKRIKELEYREFLLTQIEDKRKKKEEEKMIQDKLDRLEEIRLAKERERVLRNFEIEKEKQRKKEIDAAQKISLMEQRIKEAERNSLYAKKQIKKSHLMISNNHDEEENPINYTNEECNIYYQEDETHSGAVVKFSDVIRSPSLHTIPPIQSSQNLQEKSSKNYKNRHRKSAQMIGSQTNLCSTSSEEPTNVLCRRNKPRSDPVASRHTRPSASKESRIQRKNILRKQLQKNVRGKSDSESEGKEEDNPGLRHAGQTTVIPVSNSVVRSKVKQPNKGYSNGLRMQYRPSSNESQDDHVTHHVTNNNHSLPRALNRQKVGDVGMTPLYPLPSSSPPVPAVARRLAQGRPVHYNDQVNDIHSLDTSGMTGISSGIINGNTSPPIPTLRRLTDGNHSNKTSPKAVVQSQSVHKFYHQDKLPEIIQSPPSQISNSTSHLPFNMLLPQPVSLQIDRAPTCSPDIHPVFTNNGGGTNFSRNGVGCLPPIQEVLSREEKKESSLSNRMSDSGRQKEILNQLLILRQGIVSQTENVDSRIASLLYKNTL